MEAQRRAINSVQRDAHGFCASVARLTPKPEEQQEQEYDTDGDERKFLCLLFFLSLLFFWTRLNAKLVRVLPSQMITCVVLAKTV
jgi:hypothetical protein